MTYWYQTFRHEVNYNLIVKESTYKYLQNDLPQGVKPLPILFNVCTIDLISITSRNFRFVDDNGLVTQDESLKKLKEYKMRIN